MENFVEYPIRTLTLVKDYEVIAHFKNGDVKRYDFPGGFCIGAGAEGDFAGY